MDPAYYAIYYTYMYTTFLAIGPLALLILLNVCVVYTVVTKSGEGDGKPKIFAGPNIPYFRRIRHDEPDPRRFLLHFL